MRADTTATIVLGTIALAMLSLSLFLTVLMINEAFGTREDTGEPYQSSYSYCQTMSYGAKGTSWCSSYATGHETRQRHVIKGLWFDGQGDHLVSK